MSTIPTSPFIKVKYFSLPLLLSDSFLELAFTGNCCVMSLYSSLLAIWAIGLLELLVLFLESGNNFKIGSMIFHLMCILISLQHLQCE